MTFSHRLRIIQHRLQAQFRREKLDTELEQEFAFHFNQLVNENRADGMAPEEARQAARRKLGNVSLLEEQCRDQRRLNWLDDFYKDVIYAWRLLVKSPAFTLVAIVSLSLGIGANTAIFTLLNAVIFRSLPTPHPERIVQIASMDSQGRSIPLSYPQIKELRAHQNALSSVAGWLLPLLNVEVNGTPSQSAVLVVTEGYYAVFPVHALFGRTLLPSDWRSAAGGVSTVAVISYQCWERRFGRDRAVLGKIIRIEGRPFTVVGVMPEGFSSPQIDVTADVTVPVEVSPLHTLRGSAEFDPAKAVLLGAGRLRNGISLQQAKAQLAVLWPGILHETQPPELNPEEAAEFLSRRIQVESGARGQSFLRNRFSDALRILMAAVAMLLFLACINVASLLLARSGARAGEFSLRLALGARRGRLLRQLLTESLLLGASAGVAGSLLAIWFSRMLLPFMWSSPVPLTIPVQPNLSILAFTILIALAATIVFGLAPGWLTIQESLNTGLRQSARSVIGRRGSWLRRSLVTGQVALAVTLLAGAGLLLRTAQRLRTTGLGFQPEHVAVLYLNPKVGGYQDTDMAAYSGELLAQVSSVPGVASAALSDRLPVSGLNRNERVSTPPARGRLSSSVGVNSLAISYGFFRTMGTPIVRGRGFSQSDTANAKKVVIVSQSVASRLFPHDDAVGHTILVGNDSAHRDLEIVGVAKDNRFGDLQRFDPLIVYFSIFQQPKSLRFATLEVRAVADPSNIIPAVDSRVRSLNREYCYWSKTLNQAIDISLAEERMLGTLSTFFAVVALFLALIGIFGLLAFTVNRRIREFGVRMALGADRTTVFRLVLAEAAVLLTAGIAIGIPLALGAAKLLASRVPGLETDDPTSFAAAASLILFAGAIIAAVPARRAARIDPAEALRAE